LSDCCCHESNHGSGWIFPEEQVQLGVQGLSKVEPDDYLAGFYLASKPTQTCFISVSRSCDGQLVAQFLRH